MLPTESNPGGAKASRQAGQKYSGLEQCRAVLLVWTERKTATQVCRVLKISSGLLSLWQERAMEGMLAALEPREGRERTSNGPLLSSRVKRLLDKTTVEREGLNRLKGRLARLGKRPAPPAEAKPEEGKGG